jgi:hypothetical protein
MRTVRFSALAAAALCALLLLAACGGDDESPTPTASASPAGTASSSPAPSASAPASPVTSSATPSPEPFSGGTEPVVKEAPLVPPSGAIMTDVRTGAHDTFDRIVFDFQNGLPGYRVEYVAPPIIADPSGLTVQINGSAFLSVRFYVAAAHDPDTGQPTYTGASQITPGLASVLEIERTGDFEGYLTWVFGLPRQLDFRVLELTNPYRIAIDIAHP